MTGRLTRIENIVNSTLDSLHVKVVPRGIPYFIDSLLRGTTRFAKRTGNSNALINTDNTFLYESDVSEGQERFNLSYNNDWITVGSILSFSNKEKHIVDDILDRKTVILNNRLKFSYSAESDSVLLHAVPLKPTNIIANSIVININSQFLLANGDTIAYFSTSGVLQSMTEIKVKKVIYTGVSSDPIYKHNYNLELSSPIIRDIDSDEDIYLRAYPAYFSGQLRVPNLYNSTNPMGMFLIDYLSGRIVEGFNPKETFSVKLRDRGSQYHVGSQYHFESISKNYPVTNRPINSKSFVFFDQVKGDTKVKPNRVVFESSDFNFRSSMKLVPNIDFNDQGYRFTTQSNSAGILALEFQPDIRIELPINVGIQSHSIVVPSGFRNQMEIIFIGDSKKNKIEMSDWTQIGPQIETIEYSIVAESVGRGKYQSTGVMLKPIFLTTEILSGRYDVGDNYDSGFVYF